MILAIEIGGTKLQLAVGDGQSTQFAEIVRRDVDRSAGAKGILQQIRTLAPDLIQRHDVTTIGIGFGGPVDTASNTTITSHHVQGWDNVALGQWCQDHLGLKALIDNDCNVAALAEARLGAGADARRVFYVTVGTGIGGGLVVDGIIYGSDRPAAAEIGHLRPGLEATSAKQTVESFASGSGIENQARLRLTRSTDTAASQELLAGCYHDPERLTGQHIAAAWQKGNAIASETMNQATQTLGWAIAQSVTLTTPEIVVIGGGVSMIGKLFMESVQDAFDNYLFPPLQGAVRLVPAQLGEEVVLHGAILLAKSA